MHTYGYDTELVRIAIVLGVVVSMLFYSKYNVTTGGAIVSGYLALFVGQPVQIVMTLAISFITTLIVQNYLRPRYMLFGRRLFEAEVLTALILQAIWLAILSALSPLAPNLTLLHSIGFLLPGIIAHDMGRQGVRTTIWAVLASTLIVFGVITLLGATRDILDLPASLGERVYFARESIYAFPFEWIFGAIVVSVITSIILFHRGLFHDSLIINSLRTSGFVTPAFLALNFFRPLDILFVLFCGSLTYLIVTRVLMRHAILFGRSKLAAMFLTGMLVTWMTEILIYYSGFNYIPWADFAAITPSIVTLLANDTQRQGVTRSLIGTSVATIAVLAVMSIIFYVATLIEPVGTSVTLVP